MELRPYAYTLRERGFEVVNSWIDVDEATPDHEKTEEQKQAWAQRDVVEVMEADVLIVFLEEPWNGHVIGQEAGVWTPGAGGHHFEMGVAWALGKGIYTIGERSMFAHLPGFTHFKDWYSFLNEAMTTQVTPGVWVTGRIGE